MKVTVFTAADYVDMSGGKLIVVGAFDNIEVDKCPFVFKPFGVAAKIMAEPGDIGKRYEGKIVLKKVRTKKALLQFRFGMEIKMASPKKVNTIVVVVGFVGVEFKSLGEYHLDLLIGSRVRASTKLNVLLKTTPPAPIAHAGKELPTEAKK